MKRKRKTSKQLEKAFDKLLKNKKVKPVTKKEFEKALKGAVKPTGKA